MAKLRYIGTQDLKAETKDEEQRESPSERNLLYRVESLKSQLRLRRRDQRAADGARDAGDKLESDSTKV